MADRVRSAAILKVPVRRIEGAVVARVVGFDGGRLRVDCDGVKVARRSAAIGDEAAAQAARVGAEVVLVFEKGDASRPIAIALLQPEGRVAALVQEELVVAVDGKRVAIEGREEVTLRCGKASLTLSRDGKVVLRGVNVISQADEVHKVRGGKVQIN